MKILVPFVVFAAAGAAQLRITTSSVPVATQYQSYSTTLSAAGGTPPYKWSVVSSTGVSLPEGMALNPSTGVVSATAVSGAGGYTVTVHVADSAVPPAATTANLNFGVNSDSTFGGCQMFPPDNIYNQRIDSLPVDTDPTHQIPAAYLSKPIHPDFGHGFYPSPGGIPFMMVPANQPAMTVVTQGSGQFDNAGAHAWPFPAWPNAAVEGTAYGFDGDDHHILILQSSVNNIHGPQTGPCTLYESYSSTAVPGLFGAGNNTWTLGAVAPYTLNSDKIAVSETALDNGAQDSAGIPIVPLLVRYSEVPLGIQHPLRITFPSPTNWFVWPATGCCTYGGPPQGLLYRLKAGVNWQAACPVSTYPQAATVLQALQQYGAYMSDHGSAGFITGAPDVRWDDLDLACMKNFHVSDLEVVDNSALYVSDISGQTTPYVGPASLPDGVLGAAYRFTIPVTGGDPANRQVAISSGTLPPGLSLDAAAGVIGGTPAPPGGSLYGFSITAMDTASGYTSAAQAFTIKVPGNGPPTPDLNIAKKHLKNFRQGQKGATYSITVGNNGLLATSGTVTVTETIPAGLTLVSMSGAGWTCATGADVCTRADSLGTASAYPPIVVTVDVAADAPASVINVATVAGGGETNFGNDSASDLTTITSSLYRITTTSVPVATQYQSYSATMLATGGTPPYLWSVDSSTGVALPEGMTIDPASGVISATRVTGQGGYAVTVQVTDHGSPSPSTASATLNFGVNSDSGFGGCQMFPADSIYNQRVDQLPVDTNLAHQIPGNYLASPLHPDFGHGFGPYPGGIPFTRVPANQPPTNVRLSFSGQMDGAGVYSWPFPPWPNAAVETGAYGEAGADHHILVLQSGANSINGPQAGACTLYETYDSSAVVKMFDATTNTWRTSAGVHYALNSNEIVASEDTIDNGAQDSTGIPIVPLLVTYNDVLSGIKHPLRMTFPSPTNWFVWPATGCCAGSGPPQGLLYRLKAGVNWQSVCPAATNPQAATVLQALQQYGAYMSDHGSAGFISGAGDVRWDDNDLACIKNFHVSELEVVDNSMLEVSDLSGQTKPWIPPATLPNAVAGSAYIVALPAVGGAPSAVRWSVASGALPPGLTLDAATGKITGTLASSAGSPFTFGVVATDTASGLASAARSFSIAAGGAATPAILSLTSSASLTAGAIAPGELVTIKGHALGPVAGAIYALDPVTGGLPLTLGGTRVTFGSTAAPILYASESQINAIVPWEVAGQSQVSVTVQSSSGSGSLSTPVAVAAPGVFTANSMGAGQASALNQDGSVNGPSNPAAPGSYISVYFTGGGVTDPPGATGSITGSVYRYLTQNVTAAVGNVAATVAFAGAAPLLPDGVNQLNLQLSPATPVGDAVPLVVTVGGRATSAAVTIAVR